MTSTATFTDRDLRDLYLEYRTLGTTVHADELYGAVENWVSEQQFEQALGLLSEREGSIVWSTPTGTYLRILY